MRPSDAGSWAKPAAWGWSVADAGDRTSSCPADHTGVPDRDTPPCGAQEAESRHPLGLAWATGSHGPRSLLSPPPMLFPPPPSFLVPRWMLGTQGLKRPQPPALRAPAGTQQGSPETARGARCAVTISDSSDVTSKVFAESAEEKAHPWRLWPGTGVPQQLLVPRGLGGAQESKKVEWPQTSAVLREGPDGAHPHGGPSESDPLNGVPVLDERTGCRLHTAHLRQPVVDLPCPVRGQERFCCTTSPGGSL